MTPLSLRRFPRTAGAAFKDADYAQAFWPHEPEPVGFWSAVSYWPALILCIAAFALFTGCAGPSDTETLQATADSVDDAIAQAVVTAKARTK